MKKIKLLAMVLLLTFLTSCSGNFFEKEVFKLVIDNPQTTIKVGEEVTFTARLTNLTDKKYMVEHSGTFIGLYIRNANEEAEDIMQSNLIESDIEPNESIEKVINVVPSETGDFLLRAFSSFKVDDIPITVVE